jgi:hypothetical protein
MSNQLSAVSRSAGAFRVRFARLFAVLRLKADCVPPESVINLTGSNSFTSQKLLPRIHARRLKASG